jgi:hypothetical protein
VGVEVRWADYWSIKIATGTSWNFSYARPLGSRRGQGGQAVNGLCDGCLSQSPRGELSFTGSSGWLCRSCRQTRGIDVRAEEDRDELEAEADRERHDERERT